MAELGNRTKNAKRNSVWGFLYRLLSMVLPFFVKTAIIKIIGAEYLGLSGLFVSILNVLNVTELGFGSAIVFSMYEPAARQDKTKICALLNYYRSVYRKMGLIILGVGIIIMPFLPYLIKSDLPA